MVEKLMVKILIYMLKVCYKIMVDIKYKVLYSKYILFLFL